MYVHAKRLNDEWVVCSKCGHKLFRLTDKTYEKKDKEVLEVKCHSCKALNRW